MKNHWQEQAAQKRTKAIRIGRRITALRIMVGAGILTPDEAETMLSIFLELIQTEKEEALSGR